MRTTFLEGLQDEKRKIIQRLRDKIIIYTKIEAEQNALEAIKWALIKMRESG